MNSSTKWLFRVFGSVAGVGLTSGAALPAGASNVAPKTFQSCSAAVASAPAHTQFRSLADQVEEVDTAAFQALGGGRVVAVSHPSASQWIVSVRKGSRLLNVKVNGWSYQVLHVSAGTPSPNAVR